MGKGTACCTAYYMLANHACVTCGAITSNRESEEVTSACPPEGCSLSCSWEAPGAASRSVACIASALAARSGASCSSACRPGMPPCMPGEWVLGTHVCMPCQLQNVAGAAGSIHNSEGRCCEATSQQALHLHAQCAAA